MLNLDTPLLATSRFRAADTIRQSGFLPVSVAIGMPSWPLEYDLVRESPVRSMCAPWGLLHLELNEDEFRASYVARLDRVGGSTIIAGIERLAREHDREGVVLLCWEDLAKSWCHRTQLARYLEDGGAGPIRELS